MSCVSSEDRHGEPTSLKAWSQPDFLTQRHMQTHHLYCWSSLICQLPPRLPLCGSSWTHVNSVSMKIWQHCPTVQRILLELFFKRTGAPGLRGIMQCAYDRRTDERHIDTYMKVPLPPLRSPSLTSLPQPQKPTVSRRSRVEGRWGQMWCLPG